jgi:hypothetical protein
LANGDRWEPQLARNIESQIRQFWLKSTNLIIFYIIIR